MRPEVTKNMLNAATDALSKNTRTVQLDELLSVNEFAKELGGMSPWTVWGWLSKGVIAKTKVGRRTMIRRSEMQKVISEGEPRDRSER